MSLHCFWHFPRRNPLLIILDNFQPLHSGCCLGQKKKRKCQVVTSRCWLLYSGKSMRVQSMNTVSTPMVIPRKGREVRVIALKKIGIGTTRSVEFQKCEIINHDSFVDFAQQYGRIKNPTVVPRSPSVYWAIGSEEPEKSLWACRRGSENGFFDH